jgi:putative ABC transport system permease protein
MACGVFALVLMASLSEHFHMLADHFVETFGGRVYVSEKLSFWAGGGIVDEDKVLATRRTPGVAEVIPALIGRLQPEKMVVVGLPMVLVGIPPARSRLFWRDVPLAEGRYLEASDEASDRVLLGSDVAFAYRARPGDRLHVVDRDWSVVGVLSQTGAVEDRQMLVSLSSAQKALDREGLITCMVVVPGRGVDPEQVAGQLGRALPHLEIVPPSRMDREVEGSLRMWHALILGCGLVAAATGTLCIVITMTVSVTERTYEIGLKKAIGASNGQLGQEFLTESLAFGLLGWAGGVFLAALFVAAWNQVFRADGLFLFDVTPRVLVVSALASAGLGILAGTLPALAAARLDPVAALRRRM